MSTTHANWFETFFEGVAVDLWREAVKTMPVEADVDYIERQLNCKPGASILDIPCGCGQYSIELARRGYALVGIDISSDSLEVARRDAAAAGIRVEFQQLDMRNISGQFDGAFCWGNSFAYLPHIETKHFLKALAGALKPSSRFVLQTGVCAEALLANFKREATYQFGDIQFEIQNHYSPRESALRTEFTFTRNGKTEKRVGWQCVYTCGEICRMLAEAALTPIALHQAIDGKAFDLGARVLIITAEKV